MEQGGTAGEETSESRTPRVDVKSSLIEIAETTGSIKETAGNVTAGKEVTPAVATETATAEDEPG